MDYLALKNEILNDPKSLGYSGKSDLEIADLMNTVGLSNEKIDRELVSISEIKEQFVPSEISVLTSANKQNLLIYLAGVDLNVKSPNIRNAFNDIFAGTQTKANLIALLTKPASRAEVLGFGGVSHEQVAKALRG